MARKAKLLQRFLSRPVDFTYKELASLLNSFGYEEARKGKTSGARVAFVHQESGHIIRLHKPHPKPYLKAYQLDLVETALRERELIK